MYLFYVKANRKKMLIIIMMELAVDFGIKGGLRVDIIKHV